MGRVAGLGGARADQSGRLLTLLGHLDPRSLRLAGACGGVGSIRAVDHLTPHALGPGVQGVGVLAGQRRRAGQRLDDPRSERRLEHWQDLVADPHAGEPGIDIVRIGPRFEPGVIGRRRLCGRDHHVAWQVEQWSAIDPTQGRHARQRPRPRATGESEQHRLGLVLTGVAQQDGGCRRARRCSRRLVQGRVPSRTRRRLHATGARPAGNIDGDHPDGHTPEDQGLLGGPRRNPPGARLEPVVDHHRLAQKPELGAHRDACGRQREGVGSPTECHDDALTGLEVSQARPDRSAHCSPWGPRGGHQPSTRRTHAAGSSISAAEGRFVEASQIWANP